MAGAYDLEHLVCIAEIEAVTLTGKVTEIEFQTSDGISRKVSLRLLNTAGFLQSLEKETGSEPV